MERERERQYRGASAADESPLRRWSEGVGSLLGVGVGSLGSLLGVGVGSLLGVARCGCGFLARCCSVWVWVPCSVLLGVGVGSLRGVARCGCGFPFLSFSLFFPFLSFSFVLSFSGNVGQRWL